MKIQKKSIALLLAALVAIETGCFRFPNPEIGAVDISDLKLEYSVATPAKVFLKDGTIVIFSNGFKVEGNQVVGAGIAYPLALKGLAAAQKKNELASAKNIPLTEISAANIYVANKESMSTGYELAEVLLGLFSAALVPASIYCLACPKCCFGSCPAVYDESSGQPIFEAELFSYSVSRLLEAADIDVLNGPLPADGNLRLRITNEAMETHLINKLSLEIVEHPAGTSVYASPGLGILPVGPTVPPDSTVTVRGEDILDRIQSTDGAFFRSGDGPVKALISGAAFDSFDVVKNVGPASRRARMTIRYRNTLLTTILFYDIVLASQGLQALDWMARMNSDPVYASQFLAVYKFFSGIRVQEWKDGRWQPLAYLPDAGPLNWKTVAMDVPVYEPGEVRLRLQFFPDNFMIDAIGFDLDPPAADTISRFGLAPSSIRDHDHRLRPELASLLEKDDGRYLITEPGDSFLLDYQIPTTPPKDKRAKSLAVASKGYYMEWVRGSWVRNNPAITPFRLSEIGATIRRLAESWLRDRELLEKEFFRTRVPLKNHRGRP